METTPFFENSLLEVIAHNGLFFLLVLCCFWASSLMIKDSTIRAKRLNLQKIPMKASRYALWGIPAITALCLYLCWSNERILFSFEEQFGISVIVSLITTFTFLQWDAFGDELRRIPDKKEKLRMSKRCRS